MSKYEVSMLSKYVAYSVILFWENGGVFVLFD